MAGEMGGALRWKSLRFSCHQGSEGVTFWAGIMSNELVSRRNVNAGIKITTSVYIELLKANLEIWQKYVSSQPLCHEQDAMQGQRLLGVKLVSIQVVMLLGSKFHRETYYCQDRIYEDGKQFISKTELLATISAIYETISPEHNLKVTFSVNHIYQPLRSDRIWHKANF